MAVQIINGDCREVLKTLPEQSVHCVVTSPPYFQLRDYGVDQQMGLEPTPAEFVSGMVEVFRALRPALRDDGTVWVNIGDTYYSGNGQPHGSDPKSPSRNFSRTFYRWQDRPGMGLPKKSLVGVPWQLAFALQADGCLLASCREGGTVLDPFGGAGTTALVADRMKRNAILIELNPEYADLARQRVIDDAGMFGEVA